MPGARWLRAEREKRGWTQGDLASRLGTIQERVSAYERAQDEPPVWFARDVAREFEITEYEAWRGLELPLPVEVATRPRLIAFAMDLLETKDAEDLFDRLAPRLRAKLRGAKASPAQVKPPRITRSGGNPSLGSQGEESAV